MVRSNDLAVTDNKIMDEEKEINKVEGAPIRVGSGDYDVFLENAIWGLEAGKELKIHIFVKELYEIIPCTLEKFISDNGFESVEEYKEYIANMLKEKKKETLLNRAIESLMDEFIERSRFSMDEQVIVDNAVNYYQYYSDMASVCGGSVEEYMKSTINESVDIYTLCYNDSLRELQRYLVIGRYAEENQISISEEDMNRYCEENYIKWDGLDDKETCNLKYKMIEEQVLQQIGERYVEMVMK